MLLNLLTRLLAWLLIILLWTARGCAQTPIRDNTEKIEVFILAGVRGLDTYSTGYMLHHGCHEIILPAAIANHPAAMTAFSASATALDYLAARWLIRHHHTRTAHWLTTIDAAQDSIGAVNNLVIAK